MRGLTWGSKDFIFTACALLGTKARPLPRNCASYTVSCIPVPRRDKSSKTCAAHPAAIFIPIWKVNYLSAFLVHFPTINSWLLPSICISSLVFRGK